MPEGKSMDGHMYAYQLWNSYDGYWLADTPENRKYLDDRNWLYEVSPWWL